MDDLLTCEDCGVTNDTVETTICPYNEDMYGTEIEVTICVECYNAAVGDI
jgi:hypothetical protein